MNIEKALASYGFDEKEIALYLCLLKRLELSVFEIAKETGIARTTSYATLEAMKKKGIVNSSKKNGVVHYTPENPKQLIRILKEKEQKIEEVMPEFMKLLDVSRKAINTELYTGEAGVKRVFEDVIITLEREHIPILYAVSQIDIMDVFPRFMPDWIGRRHAIKQTFTHMLVPEGEQARMPELFNSNAGRETRFFPAKFPIDCSLEIYGHKTAVISLQDGEYYSIIIDSASIANTFKQFFLFAWEMIGKIPDVK